MENGVSIPQAEDSLKMFGKVIAKTAMSIEIMQPKTLCRQVMPAQCSIE